MSKKKEKTPMEILTAGYEDFIKGKEIKKSGKTAFNKIIKKSATPKKPRSTK